MEPDKVDYPMTLQDFQENQKRRLQMRKSNLQEHEDDFFGGTRKTAQIKVIQRFISKLKLDNKNYQALLTQIETLNMTKYIEEVSNIIANSVNEKQITFYVQIASKINASYENVPTILIKDLSKVFNACLQSVEDNKNKLKGLFLFTAELFVCGFSFSYKEVIDMLKKIFKSGKNKRSNHLSELEGKLFIYWYSSFTFVAFLISFADIFTKRVPVWMQHWQKLGHELIKFPEVMPIKMKDQLTFFFTKYATQCYQLLKETCTRLKEYEEQLLECLKKQGQFNKEVQKNYNQLIEKFSSTRDNLKKIALAINEDLQFDSLEIKITQTQEIVAKYINKAENAEIYEDEFQKQIYENIPDDFIDVQDKNVTDQIYKEFRITLDNCKNVQDSNEIAKQFSKINTKKTRKLLAKDVLEYRKQYHLVTPYLCRVVAIINKKHKDIGEFVNELIFSEYDKLKENTQNTFVINDKKSRYFKYICEFTKFGVIDPEKTMNCIENLIDNLNGYNIELIVAVLENVGRFLHLSETSANRFTFLMNKYENVIKKKSFPIFTSSQLINSINLLKPRKQSEKKVLKEPTVFQKKARQAISMCILDEIDDIIESIDELLKTEEGRNAVQEQILKKIGDFDFINSYNYAYLLQEISDKELSNYIVDRSIQNLQLYLLSNENQKTILWAKFLAELYKYKQLERSLLFNTIKTIMKITTNDIGVINAICNILEACLGYLNSKKINKNNEKFLILADFRRFLSRCRYIPMLEEFQIVQVLEGYHPYIPEIEIGMLNKFIQQIDDKMRDQNKQFDYFIEFDRFLDKNNLRKKEENKTEEKEQRGKIEEPSEKQSESSEKMNSTIVLQSKAFEKQLVDIMEATRKEYTSRIAKPVYLQKNIEKRKQKKKPGSTITIIGRSGSRFIRKDLPKDGMPQPKQ